VVNAYEVDVLYRLVASAEERSMTVRIMDAVTEDDFGDPACRDLFRTVRQGWETTGRLTPETFMRCGILSDIITGDSESRFFPIDDVIGRLKVETVRRKATTVGNALVTAAGADPEKALEVAARQILEIRASVEAAKAGGEYSDAVREWRARRTSPALTAEDVYEKIVIARERGGRSFSSGLWWWDEVAGRFRRGNTYVLAGYPGVGKTTLALNLGWAMSIGGLRVWYYGIELLSEETFEILAGLVVGKANLDAADEVTAYATIQGSRFRFFEPNRAMTWSEHLAVIERTARAERFDLVIIDNFSFLVRVGRNKLESEEEASGRLKGLAQELSIPILVLHHLRKPESDQVEPEPTQHSVRGSGAICADASDVFVLHHPLMTESEEATRSPVGFLMCGKPRWGKGGKRYVRLEGDKRLYSPATWDEYPRKKNGGGRRKFGE
jgi:replicative DNA helicase